MLRIQTKHAHIIISHNHLTTSSHNIISYHHLTSSSHITISHHRLTTSSHIIISEGTLAQESRFTSNTCVVRWRVLPKPIPVMNGTMSPTVHPTLRMHGHGKLTTNRCGKMLGPIPMARFCLFAGVFNCNAHRN